MPPPVAVDLWNEPLWRFFCALLWAAALAASLFWLLQGWGVDQLEVARAPVLAVVVGVAWGAWRHAGVPRGRLEWSGQEWSWRLLALPEQPAQPCAPRVMIDLGSWMLLRLGVLHAGAGPDWVAVSRPQVGAAWHGLRVALYGAPVAGPSSGTAPPPST